MGQLGKTLSFGSKGRFKFRLPNALPGNDGEHAENWRAMEQQWNAAPFPYRFGWEVKATAAQSLTSGTDTVVALDTAIFDPNGFFSRKLFANSVAVPPGGAGSYVVQGQVTWDTVSAVAGTGFALLVLRLGAGSAQVFASAPQYVAAATGYRSLCFGLIDLNDGDTVYMVARHSSGAARNLDVSNADGGVTPTAPYFAGRRIAVFG